MNKQSLFSKCILAFGVLTSSFAFAGMTGGVSGGGGNSRTPGFLTPDEVARVIEKSSIDALAAARMVGHLHLGHPGAMPKALDALYSKPSVIEQAISKLKINIKMSQGCLGDDGSDNDGWFDPATPNEICISAFNLSKKVTATDMNAQVKALVLHEISHGLGLSEADATAYQDLILKYVPLAQGAATYYPKQNLDDAQEAYARNILPLGNALDGMPAIEQCRIARQLAREVTGISNKIYTQNAGLLLETHMSFRFVALQYKTMSFVAQVCYLAEPTPDNRKDQRLISAIFAKYGKDTLTMSEFAEGLGLGLRVDVVNDTIPLICVQDEADAEAASIKNLVRDIYGDFAITKKLVQGFLTSRQ